MHGWQQSWTGSLGLGEFSIPIPLTAAPDFATEHGTEIYNGFLSISHVTVSVSWRLRFEFVVGVGVSEDVELRAAQDGVHHAPAAVTVSTLAWALPVTLLPTNPVNTHAAFTRHVGLL